MNSTQFILTNTLCLHYNIEISFIETLSKMKLIKIKFIEENQYIHEDEIGILEKIMRLHYDLNVNLEGIDVIFNLLEKEQALKKELVALKNRLRLYENNIT